MNGSFDIQNSTNLTSFPPSNPHFFDVLLLFPCNIYTFCNMSDSTKRCLCQNSCKWKLIVAFHCIYCWQQCAVIRRRSSIVSVNLRCYDGLEPKLSEEQRVLKSEHRATLAPNIIHHTPCKLCKSNEMIRNNYLPRLVTVHRFIYEIYDHFRLCLNFIELNLFHARTPCRTCAFNHQVCLFVQDHALLFNHDPFDKCRAILRQFQLKCEMMFVRKEDFA